MYRVRSTDVWYNMPGVVAAYQPIAAPNPLAARQNVCNNMRLAGRHTAAAGVLPTWSGATGWTFTGSEYLRSGVLATASSSAFVCISNWAGFSVAPFGGNDVVSGQSFRLSVSQSGGNVLWVNRNAQFETVTAGMVKSSVWGLSGLSCYFDGGIRFTISSGLTVTTQELYVGANQNGGSANSYYVGRILAVVFHSATLSHAHCVALSQQMRYCHVNPDWSAWGRRRRYFYAPAPAAAALAAWRGVGRKSSPVGGSIGVNP